MTSRMSPNIATKLSQLIPDFKSYNSSLDDDELKEMNSKLIDVLEDLQTDFQVANLPHTLFSDTDLSTLYPTGIRCDCNLRLVDSKMDQIEASGKADDLTTTTELINLVQNHWHVWLETDTGKAGCCMMIDIILLHIAKAMYSQTSEVVIIPQFPIEETTFNMGQFSMPHSFSGVVDYLLAHVPPGDFCNFLHESPDLALMSSHNTPVALVIRAKKDKVMEAFSQSVITAASYCKRKKLSVIRGCMTSGEEWSFFVYKGPTASGGKEALFSFSEAISLGSKLERLPLILGLLKDMVANPFNFEQKYFKSHYV
ncbi:hypothetical protein F5887DRAFT_1281087 [Amanita rubescens]|nr:hypothetical protein F5887DRAFT_1281087 [Amanita rubescens]